MFSLYKKNQFFHVLKLVCYLRYFHKPIYQNNIDDIESILFFKNLSSFIHMKKILLESINISSFFCSRKKIYDLLNDFKKKTYI